MNVIDFKCPNCGAKYEIDFDEVEVFECKFCESTFSVSPAYEDVENDAATPSEEDDEWYPIYDFLSFVDDREIRKKHRDSFYGAVAFYNQGLSLDEYMALVDDIACTNNAVCTKNINKEVLDKMTAVIADNLLEDEEVLVYRDTGIFRLERYGYIMTDRGIHFISKKGNTFLAYEEMISLRFSIGYCEINMHIKKHDYDFSDCGINDGKKFAVFIGLLFYFIDKNTSSDFRLRIILN